MTKEGLHSFWVPNEMNTYINVYNVISVSRSVGNRPFLEIVWVFVKIREFINELITEDRTNIEIIYFYGK